VYQFLPLSPTLSRAFCSAGVWVAGAEPGSILLPADPEFELLCSESPTGELSNFHIVAPTSEARWVKGKPGEISLGIRFRPEWAAALLAADWTMVFESKDRATLFCRLEALVEDLLPPDSLVHESVTLITQERLPIHVVADKSGYSYEQWLRRFRTTTKISPIQLAAYHRLRFATEFARENPDATLLDVSILANFSEAAALAHAAKRQTGRAFRQLVSSFRMPD
jgi:AraC-like DNA-binding protein